MHRWTLLLALCLLLLCLASGNNFFHQVPEQHKLAPGWQEPGLWRPKWIMDRVFTSNDGKILKKDRVYFKLKSDRTMKIYTTKSRPLLEIGKKNNNKNKKKKLFETGKEKMASLEDQYKSMKSDESQFTIDGTWWWQDASPLPQGKVKLETREGANKEKIRHDTRCDWGKLDGYAANFRIGKIFKYKLSESGVPLGDFQVGSFTIRVNPHRPLVTKEYVAFQ